MEHHELTIPTGERLTVTYLDRHDWGGGPLRAGRPLPAGHVWQGWALHHTVMVMGDYDRDGIVNGDLDDVVRYMRQLQVVRPDLGGEVPYPFVAFPGTNDLHAVICEGRGAAVTGAHTAGLNSSVLAWALAGNHVSTPVSAGQVWAMRWLAHRLTPHATRPTIGHRQAPPYFSGGTNLNATACPGDAGLSVVPLLQPPFGPLVGPPPPDEEDDDVKSLAFVCQCPSRPRDTVYWLLDLANGVMLPLHNGESVETIKATGVPEITLGAQDADGFVARYGG